MSMGKVHTIILKNTDSHAPFFMSVGQGRLDAYTLNPCSYGEQSIDFYTCPYNDNVPDELYTFILRAARGSLANDDLVFYASPNLDIYFYTSDAIVYRGKITRVDICTYDNRSTRTIHCEFCLYHDPKPLPATAFAKLLPRSNARSVPEIDRIIFNDPATIVYWTDETKTVVKAHDDDFSEEHGLAMAIAKKFLDISGEKHPRAAFKRLVENADKYSEE